MKFTQNIKITILLIGLCWIGLQAQSITETITKTGTTAASFLKIGADARGSSMGNAFVAMSGDIGSIFWNPAGIAGLQGLHLVVVNNAWLVNTDVNFAAATINTGRFGVLGLSVNSLSVPRDIVRTVENPEGTGEYWEAGGLALNLTYARKLTDHFSLGGTVKMIHENIWHSKATTVAGDLGILFITPFGDTRLGASISNYGGGMRLDGRDLDISIDPDPDNLGTVEYVDARYKTDRFPLPLMFRVGVSSELINTDVTRLSFALDAIHPNDNTEAVNAGVELALNNMFFLRTGYANLFRDTAEEGLSYGLGINYRIWGSATVIKIDYSYTDFQRLKGVQRVSLGFKL